MADSKNTTEISSDVQSMSFEAALAELEQIVRTLESGKGKLDEAIAAYERGAALKKHCEAKLREAQEKVERISISTDGSITTEPADVS
jgi:exodeoxyribonuclease VII small subunit